MLLRDVIECSGAKLQRCASFENLGFVSDSENNMLTFLDDERFLKILERNPSIAAVVTSPRFAGTIPDRLGLVLADQPRLAFAYIHNRLCATDFYGYCDPASIHLKAEIHASAFVADKGVRIGPGVVIGPRAMVLEGCSLGPDCVIGAGCILGAVGFQTVRTEETIEEMRHAGGLVLRSRVHVLPGATIARGLFRNNTEIGDDARIGAQAFVSHTVQVGRRSFVGHGSVVNGNVQIGASAWIGPGAVIANNLRVGDGAVVSLGSVVISDVDANARVSGNFAQPHRALLRALAAGRSS